MALFVSFWSLVQISGWIIRLNGVEAIADGFSLVVESHWSNVNSSVQAVLLLSTGLEETKRVMSVWITPSVHHIPIPVMFLTHHTCTYGSTRSTVKKNIITVEPRSKDKRLIWTPVYYYNGDRQLQFGGGVTLKQCKQLCPSCAAIEYWSGNTKVCYECLDHTRRTSFTNTKDGGYPPHVYIRQQWTTPSTRTATKVAAEP